MAGDENIVNRHRNGLPLLTSAAKAAHTLLALNSLTRSCGNYLRNRFLQLDGLRQRTCASRPFKANRDASGESSSRLPAAR